MVMPSVELNKTFFHTIENEILTKYNDNHTNEFVFINFIQKWLEDKYSIVMVNSSHSFHFIDKYQPSIRYHERIFQKNIGCVFCPSKTLGTLHRFDKLVNTDKANKLIYCLISNMEYPKIKVKFVRGIDLLKMYPKGRIPVNDHDLIFTP